MEIIKPIFIVGTGRSGTTFFYRILIQHKSVTSFTNWDAGLPKLFKIGVVPLIEKNALTRKFFKKFKKFEPSKEMRGILEYANILQKPLPLSKEDVESDDKEKLKSMIKKCLKYHKAERFVGKNTTNGLRLEYLNHIFPDAFFIHVIRDGRANINSFLNVDWFEDIEYWWAEGKAHKDLIKEGKSPEELAALHWKRNTEEVIRQSKSIDPERYYEAKYEDFTNNPLSSFKKVLRFCELEWYEEYENLIRNSHFENRNYKWQENLNREQIEQIEKIIGDLLGKLGYD